ncbi:type II toxin-antitoxin system HipA family toxin [Rariglobus hedericola]|uniref:Type II toxin-antitoxin system HipA family toxin n=1 Tax=Rariglobus hedericola TaxID=2597822 RepID=A0A556QNS8_9BACT|nr:type II toxin-antitoxin system HipA family toxin [Rariglobus hedericola]TSJ78293.1 type II toxin-antitoxin system HipA family toxin [Rariglobus hedericola]
MSRVTVNYQGIKVGELAVARGGIFFEYAAEFIASGHELSPFHLSLSSGVKARDTAVPTMRLHGLFEDSLPDHWGRRVMTAWFRERGTPEHAVTPLMMLAYVGQRAMGALDYTPELDVSAPGEVTLPDLYTAAAEAEKSGEIDLDVLAQIGSSAGGARPKALLNLPDSGTGPAQAAAVVADGYSSWIVKFDTTRDGTAGPLEEAYARMARAAGVDFPETRLLETKHADGVRRHFAVKRFDREGAERLHHHTLGSLLHAGGGDLDYQTLLRATRRLTKDEREVWRAYRRAVFNVLAGNRDDHAKNHGFIYRNRAWTLGPAYDLTFTSAQQMPERGMAVCGERRRAGLEHLKKLAASESLDAKEAARIIDEVRAALAKWRAFANDAGVPTLTAAEIEAAW